MGTDLVDLNNFDDRPDERYSGLSERNMLAMTMLPFTEWSPLQFKQHVNENVLDELPFLRLCEDFLSLLYHVGPLKLTLRGHLPFEFIRELKGRSRLEEWPIETRIESSHHKNALHIHCAREVCALARLTKTRQNKLSLTNKGEDLLFSSRWELFKKLLYMHDCDFDMSTVDLFNSPATGQIGSHVVWYYIIKYGQSKRPTEFYGKKYLNCFPYQINEFRLTHPSPLEQILFCVETRIFTHFLDWWGFTKTDRTFDGRANLTKATGKLEEIFDFIPR